jgi:hypothetical protein
MTKQMLILTGPQGAGNHLWSKILSIHPEVYGWKSLLDNYWEAHRFAEPFCEYWRNTKLLDTFDWSQSEYYFTSISCPLGIPGSDINPLWMPNIIEFANAVCKNGVTVKIAVTGRDQTILNYQQTRVRRESTFHLFTEHMEEFDITPIFLSYELLYLYKGDYLRSLDRTQMNIPIAWNDPRVNTILEIDANEKYIHSIDTNPLDQCNTHGTPLKHRPE